jgi:MATE family multidrug resistance protein
MAVSTALRLPRALSGDRALRQTVFWMALPAVGEQLLNTLVGLVDTFLTGHLDPTVAARLGYDPATALASVGLGNLVVWISTVLFMAVATGATAIVARRVGEGDEEAAASALRQTMILTAVVGAAMMVIGSLMAAPLMRFLGASPEVARHGSEFFQVVALSFVPAAMMFGGTAALRGAGDTRVPMMLMGLVNGINIVVAWLLVNGNLGFPAMGVVGSAAGAAAGRTVGAVVLLALLLRGRLRLPLRLDLRPHWPTIQAIMRLGLPAAGEQFIFQAAMLIVTPLITGLGTAAYAAHTTTITIESVSFLPGMGFGAVAGALMGQALGARDPERARRSGLEALFQGGVLMSLLGTALFLWPEVFFRLMTSDQAVIEAGTLPLRIAGLGQIPLAFSFILNGALRGAGDTRWPMISRVIASWMVRMPLAVLLVGWLGYGLGGIWVAMFSDFAIQGALAFRRFRAGAWQKIVV